jgi:tetratricopeptide (TPR) repeat protein
MMNKSLLRQESSIAGESRFIMLETIQEFAIECLQQLGEWEEIQYRHANYFIDLAESAQYELLGGANQQHWLGQFSDQIDNLRLVLRRCLGGSKHELAQRLMVATAFFWYRSPHHREFAQWMKLAIVGFENTSPVLKAGLLFADALQGEFTSTPGEFVARAFEAAETLRAAGDRLRCSYAMIIAINAMGVLPGKAEDALAKIQWVIDDMANLGDKAAEALGLNVLANIHFGLSQFEAAHGAYEQCLQASLECGDVLRQVITLGNLARTSVKLGAFTEAEQFVQRKIGFRYRLEIGAVQFSTLWECAEIAFGNGEYERAAKLLGAYLSTLDAMGLQVQPHMKPLLAEFESRLHNTLGARFEESFGVGRTMSFDDGLNYALEALQPA